MGHSGTPNYAPSLKPISSPSFGRISKKNN